MADPLFSILLPSRNRLDLLKFAIASIAEQGWSDVEIVISDNASEPSYEPYVRTLANLDVNYIRSEEALSVTANWNRALEVARGRYVIMLGDDDALAPDSLRRFAEIIEHFHQPDVVYVMAYHYAYPGVFPHVPQGYFFEVNNSPLFNLNDKPYELDRGRARQLGEDGLHFRHNVSFNAQHFIWRRDYIASGSGVLPFFQSPYPDYFACFVTFLTAARIVVMPRPAIIIGISKQSFGFYYVNEQEKEGFKQFLGSEDGVDILASNNKKVRAALRAEGSGHYRNWLLAALTAERALGSSSNAKVDLARYNKMQTYERLQKVGFPGIATLEEAMALWPKTSPLKLYIKKHLFRLGLWLDKRDLLPKRFVTTKRMEGFGMYHAFSINPRDIGTHENIMDAFHGLNQLPAQD